MGEREGQGNDRNDRVLTVQLAFNPLNMLGLRISISIFPRATAPFTGETQSTILATERTETIKTTETTTLRCLARAYIIQTFTILFVSDSSPLLEVSPLNLFRGMVGRLGGLGWSDFFS